MRARLVFSAWAALAIGCASSGQDDAAGSPAAPSGGAAGGVYYVRPDGGDAAQCSGRADAPNSGSGTSQECAWNHPFQALPPGGPARLPAGAVLLVAAGSYRMGLGAPGAGACDAAAPWDCTAAPIPSGLSQAQPTRILGAGWDQGCAQPPTLWGAERAAHVLDLRGATHVEIACLELTDHSSCVEFHSGGRACQRETPPYGDWAADGLVAADTADVVLRDLDVHGLAAVGIRAGRLRDWTLEDVRLAGNGWAGWDGDIDGGDSDGGELAFRRVRVEWNGCAESYPGRQPEACWAQSAGGYGDGLGTGTTGGHWTFEDCAFLHNTSDGLDLLYLREAGSSVGIRRTIAEGNAGNQIKTSGSATIENAIVVGNCGFFEGAPFSFDVDTCRAAGNALSLALRPGSQVSVTNSTVTGEGDCLVIAECDSGCGSSERLRLRNNLFVGQRDRLAGDEQSCLLWTAGLSAGSLDLDYSLVSAAKGTPPCPGAHDLCGVDPGVVDPSIEVFDAHLVRGSLAIDAGSPADAPATDFDGRPRDAAPDIGAYEWH